jgi:hypothetical protein
MISVMISVVPPKIVVTSIYTADFRIGTDFLPFAAA